MQKCANILVKPLIIPAVIELTSVTCAAECFVGDTVVVTVKCTNTSVSNGRAFLSFTTVGTGTPVPNEIALYVPANSVATTTFSYVPTVASTTQAGCASLNSVENA